MLCGGGGGGYYTVGNNAMYVQFKWVMGLVTVVLRKFFKIIAKKLVFNPFSNNSTFQESLVCMLRYKFREAADLQGGATDLQGGANAPPPLNAALACISKIMVE